MAEPKTIAAKKAATVKGLKVVATQEGGRHRAGRHWPREAVFVPLSDLKPEQVKALKADDKLVVIEAEEAVDADPDEAES